MRLADLILSTGTRHPLVDASIAEQASVELRAEVERSVIVEATNVYRYARSLQTERALYDLPCAAPPHDKMLVEYLQDNQKMVGLLAHAMDGPFDIDGLVPSGQVGENGFQPLRNEAGNDTLLWVSENLPDQAAWSAIRWVWQVEMLQEDSRLVYGPLALLSAALDQWGRLVDVCYRALVPVSGESLRSLTLSPMTVFLATINFMQCANIETVYVDPPAALSRKHRRRGHINRDLVRYHVLQIAPKGPAQRNRSRSAGPPGGLTDFHTVRGEFHHYGDCCPGAHPPKGLFFGRHTGRYWVPSHVRGNRDAGVVDKDFRIGEVPPSTRKDVDG